LLAAEGVAVSLGGEKIAHLWMRKELQSASNPSSELGVTFGQIESGSFAGVVQFPKPWSDYKQNQIPAGVYSLRFWIMPADGNHMGVATYRDFLLVSSFDSETDPAEPMGLAELLQSSAEASGVTHPGVLALFPVWDEVSEPKLIRNDLDQWMLAIKVGSQTLGLVVEGHGEVH
jgi:hypothetical protein